MTMTKIDYEERAQEFMEWWRGSVYEKEKREKDYEVLKAQVAYELMKANKEGYEEATQNALVLIDKMKSEVFK